MKNSRSWVLVMVGIFLLALPMTTVRARGKHARFGEWLSSISEEDRARYKAAKKQALLNPAVEAANNRRRKAEEEYRKLLDAEMLKVDPSLKPLLEKADELRRHTDF